MAATGGARAHVAPLPPALLTDPIAFLSPEHARQAVLRGHLERIVRAPLGRGTRVLAMALLGWCIAELPLHVAEGEGSLHPRLLAFDEDGVLPRLQAPHRDGQAALPGMLAGLHRAAEGRAASPGFAAAAEAFVVCYRRHVAPEEAVVVPFARRVPDPGALTALAAEMARRRA